MSFVQSVSKIAKIGTLLSLVTTLFLVSDARAQEQICECVDTYSAVSVRRAPARRVARRSKIKRNYRTTATRTVVRPVYRTVYVPVREVEYATRYVKRVDDCDDDLYRTTSRVYVSDGIYANSYNGRKAYYKNGRYGSLGVDADYYDTRRIASDYGLKDGFYDGYQAGMERDAYHPENSGDYQKATNGYEDSFGDKDLYRHAYRQAYLRGYNSGWRSVAQRSTYRAVRY